MADDTQAGAVLSDSESEMQRLVAHIEARLATLGRDRGEARRKLVAALLASDKKKAGERLTARARRFAQQGGRCAACGQMFTTTKGVAAGLDDLEPLLCLPCKRARVLKRAVVAAAREAETGATEATALKEATAASPSGGRSRDDDGPRRATGEGR